MEAAAGWQNCTVGNLIHTILEIFNDDKVGGTYSIHEKYNVLVVNHERKRPLAKLLVDRGTVLTHVLMEKS